MSALDSYFHIGSRRRRLEHDDFMDCNYKMRSRDMSHV
jgi:hypothetical protein